MSGLLKHLRRFQERTEEKKKIFELAGGGKRKENEREKDKDKRKAVQYVPLIEQRRREPWRVYNEVCVIYLQAFIFFKF